MLPVFVLLVVLAAPVVLAAMALFFGTLLGKLRAPSFWVRGAVDEWEAGH